MRDECTEPVVRENLELQERLVAYEQTKADLEDRLTATRSEVTFFLLILFIFMFLFPLLLPLLLSLPLLPPLLVHVSVPLPLLLPIFVSLFLPAHPSVLLFLSPSWRLFMARGCCALLRGLANSSSNLTISR